MGISISIVLVAVGAILTFAVSADTSGVNLNSVGWILLVVGAAGALLSVTFWSSWEASGVANEPRTRIGPLSRRNRTGARS